MTNLKPLKAKQIRNLKSFQLNFGPLRSFANGVLRPILVMQSDLNLKADPRVGLLHRGTEKMYFSNTSSISKDIVDKLHQQFLNNINKNLQQIGVKGTKFEWFVVINKNDFSEENVFPLKIFEQQVKLQNTLFYQPEYVGDENNILNEVVEYICNFVFNVQKLKTNVVFSFKPITLTPDYAVLSYSCVIEGSYNPFNTAGGEMLPIKPSQFYGYGVDMSGYFTVENVSGIPVNDTDVVSCFTYRRWFMMFFSLYTLPKLQEFFKQKILVKIF